MLQDAIDQIAELLNNYPDAINITVVEKNDIWLTYMKDNSFNKKEFDNSIELLEWMEQNLTQ